VDNEEDGNTFLGLEENLVQQVYQEERDTGFQHPPPPPPVVQHKRDELAVEQHGIVLSSSCCNRVGSILSS